MSHRRNFIARYKSELSNARVRGLWGSRNGSSKRDSGNDDSQEEVPATSAARGRKLFNGKLPRKLKKKKHYFVHL
jgi:hypothetical protein